MKKTAYWIVFTLAAAGLAAYFAREPWAKYQHERTLAKESMKEMQLAEDERAQLIRERAKLKSAAGREELTRESGYVREGEQPIKPKN